MYNFARCAKTEAKKYELSTAYFHGALMVFPAEWNL